MRMPDGKNYAEELYKLLANERSEIICVYEEPFVKRADRLRMRLMLRNHRIYFILAELYEKTIVAYKNR
jgi:hypothetical protein